MKVPFVAAWIRQRQSRYVLIGAGIASASIVLVVLGQVLAALLVVIVGALLLEIEQRNARARALAQRLVAGQSLEKLEVPRGAWGELCRAINALVQEQRMQERLRAAAPTSFPEDGVRALIDGKLPGGSQRMVAVLMVSCVGRPARPDRKPRSPSVLTWQALANATQSVARQHGALLQPCGDAIMLVFGAFTERPVEASLRAAVTAAEALRTTWRGEPGMPNLAISITSGGVTITTLPGLGCFVLGAPVEQAMQIERLALASPYYRLLCDESAYYALRRYDDIPWRPTEFRVQSSEGRPQVVYGQHFAAGVVSPTAVR